MHVVTCDYTVKAPDGTSFNDAPVGLREVSEFDFCRSNYYGSCIRLREYRQILSKRLPANIPHKYGFLEITLHWINDNTGWGMHVDWQSGKVRYFLFGCDHKFVTVKKLGNCLRLDKCSNCGVEHEIDSSD